MPTDPLAPPRPELLALLDAVKDHPDDDTPRLVLADWLDEYGDRFDAGRARLIRRHIAEARGQHPSATPDQVRRDEAEVMRRWLAPLGNLVSGRTFVRGLPHVTVSGPRFLKPDVPALLVSEAFAFVQFVNLEDAGGPRMEAMAAVPEFRFVAGLGVNPFNALGVHYSAKFFGSPNLTGLRQIDFRGVDPGAAGAQALANNPALARLRKLLLVHNKLVDKAVAALAASPHLADLRYLCLSDNKIGDKGAAALAESPHLASLRELDLRANPRLTNEGKSLLRDKFGDRVRVDATLF
ncbi:MAG: TIGR02996 domain-containing protein [Planctomycetes bacterium]|nr:TIGR02996 domain-containing protein [Planctomycetota bacterium]